MVDTVWNGRRTLSESLTNGKLKRNKISNTWLFRSLIKVIKLIAWIEWSHFLSVKLVYILLGLRMLCG